MTLTVYHEVTRRNADRFWLAPEGLGVEQARAQRVGRFRKTREGARRALVAALDQERRER